MKVGLRSLAMALVLSVPVSDADAVEQLIIGAGYSAKIVTMFFELFAETFADKGYTFTVPPHSDTHTGGIDATGKYLFGRTGRPLVEKEKARNKFEILLARIPIAFVSGPNTGISKINLEQLRQLYTGEITNWKELGGAAAPVALIGREKTEPSFTVLRNAYPFCETASFDRIIPQDHEVVNYLKSPAGGHALAFGALPNLEALKVLEIDNLDAGVNVGLVYSGCNLGHPVVKAARRLSRSRQWREAIMEAGYLPPL